MYAFFFMGLLSMFMQTSAIAMENKPREYISTAEAFNEIPSIANEAYEYLKQAGPSASRFILVRHGESVSNKEKVIAGRTIDEGLSDEGIEQAKLVGRILKDLEVHIDGYYSSPSNRARQTVTLIEESLDVGTPPILDEQLYEKFYGPFEGAVESQYGPLVKAEEVDNSGPEKTFEEKFLYKYHPEMESMYDVFQRAAAFLRKVYATHRNQNILIGTHNGVMKALFMADAARRGYDVDYRSFSLGNCALLIVEVENGDIRVVASNKLKYK